MFINIFFTSSIIKIRQPNEANNNLLEIHKTIRKTSCSRIDVMIRFKSLKNDAQKHRIVPPDFERENESISARLPENDAFTQIDDVRICHTSRNESQKHKNPSAREKEEDWSKANLMFSTSDRCKVSSRHDE